MTESTVQKMHLVCPHCNATNRVPSDKLQAELNCGKCQAPLLADQPDNLGTVAFNAQLAKTIYRWWSIFGHLGVAPVG